MWHGSALDEVLAGVTHHQAAARPISVAHSIWELVLHIAVWTDVARRRVSGERVTPTDAEDWPRPRDVTAHSWTRDLLRLQSSHDELANVVSSLSEEQLNSTVPGHNYSVRTMVHGVIEHDCYHGGQIALIRKALQESGQ